MSAPVHSGSLPEERFSPQRDALDRILRSEVLDRAPNLVLFLRYVCEMQIAGRTEAIKEYNIAVEALGRCATFDQKKDSIVRVEAHRLRKRLAEYYQAAGAADPVEIVLPAGSYVPEFRSRQTGAPEPSLNAPPEQSRRLPGWIGPIGMLAIVVPILIGIFAWTMSKPAPVSTARTPDIPEHTRAASAALESAVRILSGGTREGVADHFGQLWGRDRFFVGGEVVTVPARPIRRTLDDSIYLTRREGEFRYNIPVPQGTYEVRLHFAETVFGEENVAGGGESSRVFRVQVNAGQPWLVDVVSEASGPNTATIRVYRGIEPREDGTIQIAFTSERKEAPFVNGVEVLPSPGRNMLPIRVVAGARPVTDGGGEEWLPDRYWLGGQAVQRHEKIEGPEESLLFQSERYGNFSYAVPVATDSTYALTLRFAETWFGTGRPGTGGVGSRLFDVYCNGRALLRNFDVIKEAGGPMRQLKRVFKGLEPNAQGKLNLQFVPIRNYAMVNAIEVIDEDR